LTLKDGLVVNPLCRLGCNAWMGMRGQKVLVLQNGQWEPHRVKGTGEGVAIRDVGAPIRRVSRWIGWAMGDGVRRRGGGDWVTHLIWGRLVCGMFSTNGAETGCSWLVLGILWGSICVG